MRGGGEIDRIVGERIRQRRLALRLTQRDLAEAIGTHPQRISQYEQGGAPLAMSTLAKIARALGVPLLSFVNEKARHEGRAVLNHRDD